MTWRLPPQLDPSHQKHLFQAPALSKKDQMFVKSAWSYESAITLSQTLAKYPWQVVTPGRAGFDRLSCLSALSQYVGRIPPMQSNAALSPAKIQLQSVKSQFTSRPWRAFSHPKKRFSATKPAFSACWRKHLSSEHGEAPCATVQCTLAKLPSPCHMPIGTFEFPTRIYLT